MDKIQWYLVGNKVGESDLPNYSTGDSRDELAFKAGVKEFDNFIFLKENGDFRLSANEILLDNERLGISSGKRYSEKLKNNYYDLVNKKD